MAEQAMDGRSSAAFLRQRWRTIAAMGAVGIALGVLYVTLVPARLSSTTLLLFPEASGSPGPGQEAITVTQVHIAGSNPVFDRAGKSVRPALSAAEVKQRVKVDAKTANLIEIQAFARNAQQAQTLSQAVAEAYIATLNENASSLTAVPPELSSREAALTKQLKDLRTEIGTTTQRLHGEDATSSDGRRDAQLLAELINDQTDLLVRLDKVQAAVDQASGAAPEIPDIIQPAAPATGTSPIRRLLTWALVGGLLAVAGTALVLVIRRRRDPRVRARDDLADAVGSSLLAVVRGQPQRSVAGWLALFETYEAPAEEAWAFRQVLRALVGPSDSRDPARAGTKQTPARVEHPRSLSVIALSGDQRAVAVGPQLAIFAASLGITTRFVVATRHDSVASLCAACATDRSLKLRTGLVLEAGGTEGATPGQNGSPRPSGDALARSRNGAGTKEARRQEALGDYSVVHQSRGATEAAQQEARPTTEPRELPTPRSVDLTIVFTVADRREPTLQGVPATAVTVLAISPGVATREDLARLAVAVDDAGRRIDGVVIADPDPSDRTTGRRTLDQRAMQTPLPMRMTGPSQVSMSAGSRRRAR
jgi:capsular polysaccharide biosynthesis protein